jgi:hypothetical protein
MNSIIYKYAITGDMEIDLPFGSQFLTIQSQRGEPQAWFLVPTGPVEIVKREFFILPTGVEFDASGLAYLGTFQPSPSLVYHIFERINP